MAETTEAYDWRGRELIDAHGEKVGTVAEIYEDGQSGKPEWALVKGGLFGSKKHFVPLAGASPDGESVRVTVTKDQVSGAPAVEADQELSQSQERELFENYGVPYTDEGSVTATGGSPTTAEADRVGRDTSGAASDEAMTRSEEELRVGTEQRESGRVRLRKHVVTEMVTKTVPVQREEVRVEREPITDANRGDALDGPAISEEEHEVVLHEEEPVLEKQVVPKERVRLGKETIAEEREVSEEVRKEQIETEGPERNR